MADEIDGTCASTHTIRCTLARGHGGKHTAFRTRVSWTGDVDATARLREQKCVIGEYCRSHGFIHGAEAEELRRAIEKMRDGTRGRFHRQQLQELLDEVDARDSLAFLEHRDAASALSPLRSTPQEGTTDDVTRIGELAIQPAPQHAPTKGEG